MTLGSERDRASQAVDWTYLRYFGALFTGHNIFAVKVLSDTSSCHSNVDKPQSADDDQVMSQGNIAVTVSAVVAAVGLILAAVVVCLKCRRARPPVKKQKSRWVFGKALLRDGGVWLFA